MTPGWYWYRFLGEPDSAGDDAIAYMDPASSGDWVILYVEDGRVSVADMSVPLTDFKGEWRGPIVPPDA